MKLRHTAFIARAAVIAALYAAVTIAIEPIANGPIQFRVSEAFTVLPYFTPAAIPGLFIGCVIANFYSGNIWDIIFGSSATLIAAIATYLLRKVRFGRFLAVIPPIVANTLVVPFILKYAYFLEDAIPYMMLTVGLGEAAVCILLGLPLLFALEKLPKKILG